MKLTKGVPQVVGFKSMKLLPLLILAFVLTLGVACFSEPDPLREAESYLKKGNAHVDAGFKAKTSEDHEEFVMQWERAIDDYDEAIRLDPFYAEAFFNRGIAQNGLLQFELGIEDLDKALLLDPQMNDAYHWKCYSYWELGKWELAIQNCDEFIRVYPESADSYRLRSMAYDELGDNKKAEQDYEKWLELTES